MTDLARIVIEATDNTQAGIASANRGLASLMQQAVASRGALALLGGAGIVGGLAMITQQGLEAADSAGKLAQKMGTTVEEASALSYAAKLSAVDTGTLAKGMKGLSEKLVEASDGASDTARLFKLMGVDIKGGTVPALEQVADYFAQLPDGATKTALAVKVLGKSGQEMIPFLNEGGAGIRRMKEEAKDLGLVIDGETAAAAQKFNDNLAAMKTGAEALAITLATKMAGALGNISEAMKAAYLDGGKLMALWVGLGGAADHIFGSAGLSETQRIAKEMNEIQDRMRQSGQRLQDAGDLIGKNGETTRAAIMAGIQKDFNQLKALNDQLIAIKKGEQAKATEQAEAERRKKENEEKVKAELASAEARKKAAADAAKAEAELNNLLSGISNKAAGMDADMDKKAGILFKAFASGRISLVQYSMAMTDLIQQQQFYKTALVDIAKNEEHRLKLLKEMREEEVAGINARDELLDSLEDEIKALQIETRTMGATSAERERQLDVLRMERDIKKALSAEDEERIRKLYAERGALRQARDAAKENVDAFRDTFGEMDRFASDAFANILQGGRDTFTRLADTIKTTALSALYQMTVRPWIVQFAASLTGTSSSQAAALMGNSGGGSGIGNLLGNLLGTGSGGTSAIGSAIGSAIFGNAAAYAAAVPGLTVGGTQAAMLAAQTGSFGAAGLASTAAAGGSAAGGTGILSSLGSSLSALGPYAAAAAAISAIYNAVKKPGGPKEGGGAILEYGATGNLIRTGDGGSVFGVSSQNSQFSELGSGMAATFFEKLKQLGGTVSSAGFTIGSDQDPRGTAQNRIKNFVDINGRRVYSVMDRGVGRDAGELQKQLQLESKRAILAALGVAAQYRGPRISSVTQASATDFDVNLTHASGSDFTPTSGITGFRATVAGSPVSISAVARQSASVVRVSLAAAPGSMPTIGYLYGTAPTVTSVLLDNSALALPLEYSAGVLAVSSTTITGQVAAAVASGLSVSIATHTAIAASIGSAVASGPSAALGLHTVVGAAVGSATASGPAAGVSLHTVIAGAVGAAVASGPAVTINVGAGYSISGGVGSADASGLQAGIGAHVVIAASVASATASGLTAGTVISTTIGGNVGAAEASGLAASIGAVDAMLIAAGPAVAVASGLGAQIVVAADYVAMSEAHRYTVPGLGLRYDVPSMALATSTT